MTGQLLNLSYLGTAKAAQISAPRFCPLSNVGGVVYNSIIKKGKTMNICVFCMEIGNFESCYPCKEYKGIMPLNKETLIYLGEDLKDWAEYLN